MKIKLLLTTCLFLIFALLPILFRNHLSFLGEHGQSILFQLTVLFVPTFIGVYQTVKNDNMRMLLFPFFGWIIFTMGPLGHVKYNVITLFYLFYSTFSALITVTIITKLLKPKQ